MKINIPKQVMAVLKRYHERGIEAFVVGGCVRDTLMGKTPHDWDICTAALPEQTKELFSDVRVVDTGIEHGTVTVLMDEMPLEITTYRIDGEYIDHRRPEQVEFTTNLIEDLSRRDFTINAMAYNPWAGLVDPFGGQIDIQQKTVRCVGEADLRFEEDGLRILRGIRFACVLDFGYEERTKEAIQGKSYLLNKIAKERIQVELNKILLSKNVALGIRDLYDLDCLAYIIPELCHTKGFTQNNPFHHCDVFDHTLLSVSIVPADLTLRLTMLLHDIGKPYTWSVGEEGTDYFLQHDAYGEELVRAILARLRYDRKTINQVSQLVAYHNWFIEGSAISVKKALKEIGVDGVYRLIEIKKADIGAQHPDHQDRLAKFDRITVLLDEVISEKQCFSLKQLAIDGKVLQEVGITEGKDIGTWLQRILDAVIEETILNEKDEILSWVREQLVQSYA